MFGIGRGRTARWVKIDKDYRFDTDEGSASLADLFKGRSQLLVYHFMFGPDYSAGCPSCSAIADGFNGFAVHLANHDVMLWAISRAPLAKLLARAEKMGWTFPWYSSEDTDFNYDFGVSFRPEEESGVRASAEQSRLPLTVLGRVGGKRLRISLRSAVVIDEDVSSLAELWTTAFARAMEAADVL